MFKKGEVGLSISSFVVVGIYALIAVFLYDHFAANKNIFGFTTPRL